MEKVMEGHSQSGDIQLGPTDWEVISGFLDIRAERVRILKKLVEQGDYAIDPGKPANAILIKMLREHGIICPSVF